MRHALAVGALTVMLSGCGGPTFLDKDLPESIAKAEIVWCDRIQRRPLYSPDVDLLTVPKWVSYKITAKSGTEKYNLEFEKQSDMEFPSTVNIDPGLQGIGYRILGFGPGQYWNNIAIHKQRYEDVTYCFAGDPSSGDGPKCSKEERKVMRASLDAAVEVLMRAECYRE